MRKCNVVLDVHKNYTWAAGETRQGNLIGEGRVEHRRGAIREYLARFARGSRVAVETTGGWYWVVDEIEEAGMIPLLVHARKAKARLAEANHSDKLDVRGLLMLMRVDRLPTVWIPPRELRDLRELERARMVFSNKRTSLKNRVHGSLTKYGLRMDASNIFAAGVREELRDVLAQLPEHHRFAASEMLDYVDHFDEVVREFEIRIARELKPDPMRELIDTLPCVGLILSVVIQLEVGDVTRFPTCDKLATYAGTTPRLNQSGKRKRHRSMGPVRRDVNQYLKWAYIEAANAVCLQQNNWPHKQVVRIYTRTRSRRGHGKAIVAVARHLAESTWHVLTKREPYREPTRRSKAGLSREA